MLTYSQHKLWASLSVYALAASVLVFSIAEISCETEAQNSIEDNAHHETDQDGVNEEVHLVHLVVSLGQVSDPGRAALALRPHKPLNVD